MRTMWVRQDGRITLPKAIREAHGWGPGTVLRMEEGERLRLRRDGRITVPKAVREARGWKLGTGFVVEETAEGVALRPLTRRLMDWWDFFEF